MSDATHEAPEQIWAWGWRADSVWQEQTWQHEDEPMSTMKYILATPAALAEASEVQALIAEAVEKATREGVSAPTFTAADLEAAFRVGLEMAVCEIDCGCQDGVCGFAHACPKSDVKAIRSLTPPADLGVRVK